MPPQEVVIIDDTGREHVFPPGFDPKRAAQIVRGGQPSPTQAAAPTLPPTRPMVSTGGGRGTGLDVRKSNEAVRSIATYAKEHPAQAGALAAVTLASGGLASAPALAAIPAAAMYGAAGAGAGLVAERVADPQSQPLNVRDTLTTMAGEGGKQALAQAGGNVMGAGVNMLTRALPERLYAQIFRYASDDLRRAYQSQARGRPVAPSLAREALDRGLMGSSDDMAVYSIQKLDALENQLQQKAGRAIMVLPKKQEYVALLNDIEHRFSQGFFSERALEAGAIRDALTKMPGPSARATDMLRAKRLLDGLRNSSSFRTDPVLVPKQEELKVAADLVRQTLRKKPEFAELLNEERIFIEALDAVVTDAARRQNRSVFGLVDAALSSAGPKGTAAAAAVKGAQSPRALTGLGRTLDLLGKLVTPGAATTATRTGLGMLSGDQRASRPVP